MPRIVPGRYILTSVSSRVMEAEANTFMNNGCRVQTWRLYRGLNQIWDIVDAGSGHFFLFNLAAGKAVDAADVEVDREGCPVQLWQHHSSNRNQMWDFLFLGDDRYSIRCVASQGTKVVQLKDDVVDRSAVAELGDFAGRQSQAWRLVPAANAAIVRDAAVDLRANQTPVKSQGGRGTCTYFGVTAALEAAYKKAGYSDLNLSEEFWAIMGKALWLHPTCSEVTHANYRENQFAATQGGGSVRWYDRGLRIPREDLVPYRTVDYVPSNWDSRDQRAANDFNFSLFTRNVLQAPEYFGVRGCVEITGDQLRDPAAYERALRLGYEVVVDLRSLYGGAHNLLMVGFDRSNPSEPVFFLKNSWGPPGGDPRTNCDVKRYGEVLPDIVYAAYILDVRLPGPWPELPFLGRWQLIFDGHRGVLDIYHIPGISLLTDYVPDVADRRIVVLYDGAGTPFRVNGSISGHSIEFRFSGETPNLRWDELKGRRFVYYLEPKLNVMAGFHDDGDGVLYGGLAVKGDEPRHAVPALNGFDAFARSTWDTHIDGLQGTARFATRLP